MGEIELKYETIENPTKTKEQTFKEFALSYKPYATIPKSSDIIGEKINEAIHGHTKLGGVISEKDLELFLKRSLSRIGNNS